jgi:hypothetical protein
MATRALQEIAGLFATFVMGLVMGARMAYKRVTSIRYINQLEVWWLVMIGAFIVLAVAFVFTQWPRPKGTILGDYTSPAEVLTTVDGIDGPAVKEHDIIAVRLTRCVEDKHIVKVLSTRGFINLADPTKPVYDLIKASQSRTPGCSTTDYQIPLPDGVGPGQWLVAGQDETTNGAESRQWTSETFTVVGSE